MSNNDHGTTRFPSVTAAIVGFTLVSLMPQLSDAQYAGETARVDREQAASPEVLAQVEQELAALSELSQWMAGQHAQQDRPATGAVTRAVSALSERAVAWRQHAIPDQPTTESLLVDLRDALNAAAPGSWPGGEWLTTELHEAFLNRAVAAEAPAVRLSWLRAHRRLTDHLARTGDVGSIRRALSHHDWLLQTLDASTGEEHELIDCADTYELSLRIAVLDEVIAAATEGHLPGPGLDPPVPEGELALLRFTHALVDAFEAPDAVHDRAGPVLVKHAPNLIGKVKPLRSWLGLLPYTPDSASVVDDWRCARIAVCQPQSAHEHPAEELVFLPEIRDPRGHWLDRPLDLTSLRPLAETATWPEPAADVMVVASIRPGRRREPPRPSG